MASDDTNSTSNGADRSSEPGEEGGEARTKPKRDESRYHQMDSRLVKRIAQYLKPYAGWVVLALGITLLAAMLGPLRPMLIQIAIDEYIVDGGTGSGSGIQGWLIAQAEALGSWGVTGLQAIVLFLLVALFSEGFFAFVKNYMTQWIGQRAIYDLRTDVFDFILNQPLTFFDRTPVGRLITRSTSDVEALSDVLSSGIVVILGDLFRLVFIMYFMFALDPTLAIVTLTVMPLMVWVTFWFRKHVRTHYRETRKQISRLNTFIQEHVTGMSIVQLFNRESEEMRRFRDINDDHRTAHIQTIFYFAIFWPAVQIIADVAVGAVLWFGGLGAMTDALTLGVLIAFIQYARQFFEPIRQLSDQYNTLQRAMAGAERIFGLLDHDKALKETDSPKTLDRVEGRITFENVWFTYEDQERVEHPESVDNVEWILRDISFTVEPGDTAAIVGATGAGKSTVMNVLLRFYDIQHGRILLDGVDIRDLRLYDLRRHIGMVLQDVFLFSGTVRENLTLGNDDISDDAIREAIRLVQADRFIDQLPNGLDQEVKERGASLSHGQRQLLAFVRALLYTPDVMVLDEATSSVDTETEALIQNALEAITEDRTTIAIAHRLSTIRDADQILVMHKGELREQGTHDELLGLDGLYRRLYEMQYREQEAEQVHPS